MNSIFKNRLFIFSILIYFVGQLFIWYGPNRLYRVVLLGHEFFYLIAIFFGTLSLKKSIKYFFISALWQFLLVFFIVNIILFLFWIFKIHLNPEINWTIEHGGNEVDPFYLMLYLPIMNFLIVVIIGFLFFLFWLIFYRKRPSG